MPHRVPPAARLVSLILVVVATFIIDRVLPLALAIGALAILTARAGLLSRYLRFLIFVQLPMMGMLILVWGYVTRAPPNEPMGSDPRGGIIFAALIALRLAVVAQRSTTRGDPLSKRLLSVRRFPVRAIPSVGASNVHCSAKGTCWSGLPKRVS